MFEWIANPEMWIALVTLIALEIVLGIDNIIFIAILVGRLPKEQRQKARILGLSLAMITRLLLLLSLFWIMKLTAPLFSVLGQDISGRDLILILGGLFLIGKSTLEIHHDIEEADESKPRDSLQSSARKGFINVL
ncbi:TerC family protein, partial [Helicobacter sp. UBA3407]|uniref:TerC family protein n=1 Tax=Helicobacter sp. UBA3407 TaxID=1946588 RepID=UPI00345BA01A